VQWVFGFSIGSPAFNALVDPVFWPGKLFILLRGV
jgi:hypothetical protein